MSEGEQIQRAVARLVARRLEQIHETLISARLELVLLDEPPSLVVRDIATGEVIERIDRARLQS